MKLAKIGRNLKFTSTFLKDITISISESIWDKKNTPAVSFNILRQSWDTVAGQGRELRGADAHDGVKGVGEREEERLARGWGQPGAVSRQALVTTEEMRLCQRSRLDVRRSGHNARPEGSSRGLLGA